MGQFVWVLKSQLLASLQRAYPSIKVRAQRTVFLSYLRVSLQIPGSNQRDGLPPLRTDCPENDAFSRCTTQGGPSSSTRRAQPCGQRSPTDTCATHNHGGSSSAIPAVTGRPHTVGGREEGNTKTAQEETTGATQETNHLLYSSSPGALRL